MSFDGGLQKKNRDFSNAFHRSESYGSYFNRSVLFLSIFLQWFEILYVLHFKLRTFWHFCKKAPCSNFNVACDTDVLLSAAS